MVNKIEKSPLIPPIEKIPELIKDKKEKTREEREEELKRKKGKDKEEGKGKFIDTYE